MRKVFLAPLLLVLGCGGNGTDTMTVALSAPTVVAGSGVSGAADGPIASATFTNPVNVAFDGNDLLVADFDNSRVRLIRDGQVTTLVQQTNFVRPFGLAVGADGARYVQTDSNDLGERDNTTGTIWSIAPSGAVTVVARNLGRPRGLLVLPDGRIAFSNLTRNTVEILNPVTAAVTLVAGSSGVAGFADGTGTAARFDRPYGLARMADGTLLVADQNNHRIRRVTLAGVVTTFAGTGAVGAADGARLSATFNGPQDVDIAPNGRIYVSDTTGKRVRLIVGDQVSNFLGDGVAGFGDGTTAPIRFFGLEGSALSPDGRTLVVADGSGGGTEPFNRIRAFSTR